MNYINLAKKAFLFCLVAIAFSACEKVNEITPIGDGGQTLVRILGAGNIDANFKPAGSLDGNRVDTLFSGSGLALNAIDFVNKSTKLPTVVSIRRDVANKAELNKTMTVTIKDDTTAVNRHNAINRTSLAQMPVSFYSIQSEVAKVGGQGGTYTFVFKPGEFAKEIFITIPNPTLLNPSTSYGLAFTITAVDAGGVISYSHTLLYQIGAKNDYDGVYRVTGSFVHPVYAGTFGTTADGGNLEVALVTSGSNTVNRSGVSPFGEIGGFDGFIFFLTTANGGPEYSGFGTVIPAFRIDPVTNVVTVYGKPGSTNAVTFINYGSTYDPATKSFDMHYGYGTRLINETWTYLRSR